MQTKKELRARITELERQTDVLIEELGRTRTELQFVRSELAASKPATPAGPVATLHPTSRARPISREVMTELQAAAALYLRRLATPQMLAALAAEAKSRDVRPFIFQKHTGTVYFGPIDGQAYHQLVGERPSRDDLDRVNCQDAGSTGHQMCGWCLEHECPRFRCGCFR